MRSWRCRCTARGCASAATTRRKRSRERWPSRFGCRRSSAASLRPAATAAQTGQSAAERRAGIARAFRVTRDLTGARIAIVDDVVTTGATVNALARALRAAGAARCMAVAVARTSEPDQTRNV